MKKIILISLLLIILAAGGLFAYISQIDWNTQKEKLSAQMSEIIGKKIQFSGNLQVKLWPHPQLSADNVHILSSQNGEKLATIKELETEVSLISILERRPNIHSLLLKEMEIWFTFDEDGICNWKQKSRQDSHAGDSAFNLQNFNVQKSVVHYNNKKYNVAFDLTGFNADIVVSGPEGPYRIDGNFLKENDRYGLALNVDALSQLEDVAMSVVITHPKTDSNLRYEGTYNVLSGNFNGDFSGESQKTADFVNSLLNKKIIRTEYNLPMIFSTTVQSDVEENKLSNLVMKFDNLLEGAGDVTVFRAFQNKKQKIDIKYQLVKFNLESFKNLIKEYFEDYQKDGKYEPNIGFDVAYDISSERVIVSDEPTGTWESVSAKGEWIDNIFTLDDFYAACPGNVVTNLRGSLSEKDSVPQYYIEIKVNGQNALSFINSLGFKLKSPRQSSYRDIDLSLNAGGTPQMLSVNDITLKMDKAEITGKITADLLSKEYNIEADADILNLDNYIVKNEEESEDITASEAFVAETDRFKWFGKNKVALTLKAGSATLNGVSARDVEVDFVTDGEGMAIVENITLKNMMSSDIDITAVVKNLGKNNLTFEDVTFDIKSSAIGMLADKLRVKLPKWPLFERGNVEVSGVLSGNLEKIDVNSLMKSGENSFRYDGLLKSENNHMNFSGDVLLKTGHLENLMKLFLGDVNGKLYRGPLVAKFTAKGNSKHWEAQKADVQMGSDKYTADVKVDEDKKVYKVSGNVHTTYLNLLNWINVQKTKTIPKFASGADDTFIMKPNFSGDVINYNGYRRLALDIDLSADKSSYGDYRMNNLQTHLYNNQNVLQFQDLRYENKSHKTEGNIRIDYSQTPQMSGDLTVVYPVIKNLGGSIYAIDVNDLTVNTEFETSAMTIADMIDGLKGKMSFSGKGLTLKGINLAAIKDDLLKREYSKGLYQIVRDNTQNGATSFEEFTAETLVNGGVFSLSPFILKNADTRVNVSGSVNLKEWKINNTFKVRYTDLPDIPEYAFVFSGMMNKQNIDINIEEVANKYDKHWKEVEQERLKQQENLRQQRAERIKQVLTFVEDTQEKATEVQKVLEDNMSKHLTEAIVDKYESKITEISDLNSRLEEIKAKLNVSDLSEDEIAQINNDATICRQQIDSVNSEAIAFFNEDIEAKKGELLSDEKVIYEKIKEVYNKFQDMWYRNREQLGLYNSFNYIDGNEELNRYYSKIQESRNSADNIHSDVAGSYERFSQTEDMEEKHSLAESIEKSTEQENELYAQLDEAYKQSSDMLLKIVEERRMAFEKEQRRAEEARQKQAELDAQNLLISDNPNLVPEDTYAEPAAQDSLSFSGDDIEREPAEMPKVITYTPSVSGKITTQYDKNNAEDRINVRPSSGLLTPIGNSAPKSSGNSNVSGTIKVK